MVRDYNAPHVHTEHYNAQVAIQKVVCDSSTGKSTIEMVRVNLSTEMIPATTPEQLNDLISKVIAHLNVSAGFGERRG